ncbi:MAG: hypothetical protein GY849_22785 [Deltaproteobacteria bacterium]|nr:hypothetical protein [Deltaproteobacteria bacterium]
MADFLKEEVVNTVIEKFKDILAKIAAGAALVIVILVGWMIIAWLYPNEWFADIPKFFLSVLGLYSN